MKDYDRLLRNDERAVYDLRELYEQYGYSLFRTGKFEEYELYARNKDFLGSDGILTFTDMTGKLMALKPDVTLSIAKNSEDIPGVVQKSYYDDCVYRLSRGTKVFREIPQTGIECIGDIGAYDVCEVISLAVRSLERIGSEFVLDISHMGMICGIAGMLDLPAEDEEKTLRCIGDKNYHGVMEICDRNGVPRALTEKVGELIDDYGPMAEVLGEIDDLAINDEMREAVGELRMICEVLQAEGLDDRVRFDFSVVNDMGYYNGVIFQGFINGIASSVLTGGRYDNLMIKMGKKSGAIGFSVSMDMLDRLCREDRDTDVDVLLIAGPKSDAVGLCGAVRIFTEGGRSVSVQKKKPDRMRYGTLAEFVDGEVKIIETDD